MFARRPVRNFLVTHGGVRAGFVIIPVHFNIIKHNVPFVTHLILSTEFADNIILHHTCHNLPPLLAVATGSSMAVTRLTD